MPAPIRFSAEPTSDVALLAALRANDASAFEELVRRHGGRMLAAARRLLASEDDAQDVLQEAFIAAFRAIGSFEGKSQLGTWLHRIVVNAALMRLRARRRRPEQSIEALLPRFLDDGHQAEPAVEWRATAEDLLQRDEHRDLVRAAIDELPENYRTVLKLRDIEELDTQETADMLGIDANTVKVRLHRARQALRTLLDRHFRAERS
ncbi:MAG: RNA polymerase sigma factor [Phycisphaerae bacterium]